MSGDRQCWPERFRMCAKKLEGSFQSSTAGSGNSSFWRHSNAALPGRVNQTNWSAVPKRGSGGGAHSFQNFQDSVSDAWDIEEPLTPTVKKSEKLLTGGQHPAGQDAITPIHVHQAVRNSTYFRYNFQICQTFLVPYFFFC